MSVFGNPLGTMAMQRSLAAFQQKQMVPSRPLRICYMLPHHNTTGGMKCLVEHIRLLKLKGFLLLLYSLMAVLL